VMTVFACAGHLAFGSLAFMRRTKTALGELMALLFLDAFGWNFASLAHELSGAKIWASVDHFFSAMMAAIALHVVIVFVGRARALRALVVGAYLLFAAIGLFVPDAWWWKALLFSGPAVMSVAIVLLFLHRGQSQDPDERARTDLLLFAFSIGTLLGATDLLYGQTELPIPRLGAIGTLISMSLIAVAALRLSLFGRELPPVLAIYALFLGLFWVFAHLALTRLLDPRSSPWVLGGIALALLGIASAREIGRTAALNRARGEELATLGRFSQQLAHDLKNPLAALKGAVEFLEEERRAGRSLDAQTRFLSLMAEQVERAQRTVDDYQRIAKVEPHLAPMSINALVRSVLPLQRIAVAPGVSIVADLSDDVPECPLDRELVVTALENVLRNACEAMPDGGDITVRTTYDPEVERVTLGVEDRGKGMSPMVLEHASALFFTTKAKGTGLGLSFAERVAKAHGGVLRVASKLGSGTTVTLTFPTGEEAT